MVYRPGEIEEEIEEEQEGATAMKPKEVEQGTFLKEKTPQKILRKSSIDKIRGYQREEDLIDFTARNAKKKIRDAQHINPGYEDTVNSDEWIRQVFLAKHDLTRIPTDNTYRVFYQEVKKLKDDLKGQKKEQLKKLPLRGIQVENYLNFQA